MPLSSQQKAVVEWALSNKPGESLNLIARAGCGKTYTALEVVQALVAAGAGEIWLGAYNRAIAQELQARLKALGIDWKVASAATLHSAGFGAWRYVAKGVKVSEPANQKTWDIIDEFKARGGRTKELAEGYRQFLVQIVSLAKQRAFGFLEKADDTSAWFKMIDHFGADEMLEDTNGGPPPPMDELVDLGIKILKRGFDLDKEIIDYDDMILAPLVHNARIWPKDFVIIDEAQDTNPARRALAMKMLKPKTGRLIAIGDPRQAIYGFTGADNDSMDIIKRELGSVELPLNLTYRCPKAVVKLANTWVPDIQAHESNPEGIVRSIPLFGEKGSLEQEVFTKDDVILCRNNAPIVEMAYSLLRKGIACRVEGREIGQGLIALANRWNLDTLDELSHKLDGYLDREIQKALAKGKEDQAARVEDKVETLRALISRLMEEGKTEKNNLIEFIQKLFGDTKPGQVPDCLTLSSVHKSKGREWDRVYLLGRNKYMPSKWARKDWQQIQENNLMYVAVTRAKQELVEVVV